MGWILCLQLLGISSLFDTDVSGRYLSKNFRPRIVAIYFLYKGSKLPELVCIKLSALYRDLHTPGMLFYSILNAFNPSFHLQSHFSCFLGSHQPTINQPSLPADLPNR